MSHLNLLVNHIIRTFNAKLGMLWVAGTDSFCIATQNSGQTVVNPNSLMSFLSGYYYSFMLSRKKISPFIIKDILETPNLPDDLIHLAKLENIACLLISPIYYKAHIKGTLIIGSENISNFSDINFELVKLLTNSALHLSEKDRTDWQIHDVKEENNAFGLIGRSRHIHEICKTIVKTSQSDANILIYGESGTGKELIARAIHSQSKRKDQAFIPLDCVALPETLLESELFGYERGAFTGANNIKCGLLEYADKGTFFLDEITEMNIVLQAKLLRVLQERQYRRVGGKQLRDVDIRVISATNIDPMVAIANRKLREDLFYRLNVIPIYVPPLRDRREDVPLLIEHFVEEFTKSKHNENFRISDAALHYLIHYKWPGNIRELKNLVERLIALARDEMISVEELPVEIVNYSSVSKSNDSQYLQALNYSQAKEQNLMEFERSYFSQLLNTCNGNISKVAKEAQVSRKTVYNILKKHSLNSYDMMERSIWR